MFKELTFVLIFILFPFDGLCQVNSKDQNNEITKLIQSGNFSSLLSTIAAKKQEELEGLIESSYASNIENFDAVLSFIKDWPESNRLNGYEAIFKLMERYGHLWSSQGLNLAFAISRFAPNWPLGKNFPETIYKLYFAPSGKCYLKNTHFNEYFYGAHYKMAYDSKRSRNFNWIPGSKFAEAVYDIQVVNGDVFTIRNKWNEWFYADDSKYAYDSKRRRAFSYRDSSIRPIQSEWQFIPQEGQVNVFKIRNTYYGEILYADKDILYDKERREVFTDRQGTVNEQWKLWLPVC